MISLIMTNGWAKDNFMLKDASVGALEKIQGEGCFSASGLSTYDG
ncbi:MAG: hypothetical protein AB2693_29350 [Candidatus Thiodiazotropha sp.]